MKRCLHCGSIALESNDKCGVCGMILGEEGAGERDVQHMAGRRDGGRKSLVGLGVLWGIIQFAVVEFEVLAPSESRREFLPIETIIILATAILVRYRLSDLVEVSKVVALAEVVTWLPIPLVNTLSFFEKVSGELYVVLFFYGFLFLVVGVAGSGMGYGLQGWVSELGEDPQEAIESIRAISDSGLIQEYRALQSRLSSETNFTERDEEILSAIESEIDRRRLRVQAE